MSAVILHKTFKNNFENVKKRKKPAINKKTL